MAEQLLSSLKTLCDHVRSRIHPSLSWSWDDRFHTTLMVFTQGQSRDAYVSITRDFEQNWTPESILDAPAAVRSLKEELFGIRHGQLLFTRDPENNAVLFAAWWPWENSENISLRIGLHPIEDCKYTKEFLEKLLRSWFEL